MAAKLILLTTTLLLTLFAASEIQAFDFWNDLKVTWGTSPVGAFNRMPRNTFDATVDGWVKTSGDDCENGGRFSGFQWTDPKDDGLALLFDSRGFLAGIQAMVPQSEVLVPGNKLDYTNIRMYQNYTLNGKAYFAINAYFIQPSLICTGAGPENGNIGAQSSIYFQNGPSPTEYKIAYKNRTEAIANGWTKNNCIPSMGQHNFFEVEKYEDTDCAILQPTFLLFNTQDQLIAFGLLFMGNATSPRFEDPSSAAVAAILGEAPKCILDQVDLVGLTTVHVYFDNAPWLIGC